VIRVTSSVVCDGLSPAGSCPRNTVGVVGPSVNRPGARMAAAAHGWVHRKGRDLCPQCAQREDGGIVGP
jgi:hypothetical protein